MQLNNVNKAAAVILILVLCTAFVSCSSNPPAAAPEAAPETAEQGPAKAPEQSTSAPEEAAPPAESTPAPVEQPASEPVPVPEAAAPAEAAPAQPAPADKTAEQAAPAAAEVQESSYKGALSSPIADQPAYLTSIGQSADVQMVKTLLTRAEIEFDFNATAKAGEITGKTLVLAVGGSSKGLGAAGIKAEDELARSAEIVKAAKENGMTVISVHVGGEARRGELSDKFIKEVVPYSDYIIVVADGNKDGFFDKLANGIPIDTVDKITAVVDPLKAAFK
jgi:hypothetical protein